MKYAEVILPFPLENTYTYQIPSEMEGKVHPCMRVIVPFGKKRYYTALVTQVYEPVEAAAFELKAIYSLLDQQPLVFSQQIKLWKWIASYYMCKLGDVYKAAIPSALKLESQTMVCVNNDFVPELPLSIRQQFILDLLAQKEQYTLAELEKLCGPQNLHETLAELLAQEALCIHEEVKRGYKPRMQDVVSLSPAFATEAQLLPVLTQLSRAPQQEKLLLCYLDLAQPFAAEPGKPVLRKDLLQQSGLRAPLLHALVAKGILVVTQKETSRLTTAPATPTAMPQLTPPQQAAYSQVLHLFETKAVVLLFGPPASGKTELFLHLAHQSINNQKHVLYLLPEIAVTTHLTDRIQAFFGQAVFVYHSGLSEHGRVEIWNKLLQSHEPQIIVGVRSSIFLPFPRLGLVIVDEEHEPSYKQNDPAPRYHARNAALVLAQMYGAKTILGSATPSLDSYYHARMGKYGLVTLHQRYGNGLPPRIHLVDTKELKRKKIMKNTLFSPVLKEKIDYTLKNGKQVILFQNRRGFAPLMECKACGHVVHCQHCDVSLVYHKQLNRLVCHYCNYTMPLPHQCPACQNNEMIWQGFGTEKIEEETHVLFPEASIERLDLDTTRSRQAYQRIFHDFEQGKTNILIGTQMLAKGLDFGYVQTVGIMHADVLMNLPDFRAHERAFQLIMQVSGRSGRREQQGDVVIQTAQPQHPLWQWVKKADYEGMAYAQLAERKLFSYPPYFRLLTLVLRCANQEVLESVAEEYVKRLREAFGHRVSEAIIPPINRIQRLYTRHLVLKTESALPVSFIRSSLDAAYNEMCAIPGFQKVRLHYDVDN